MRGAAGRGGGGLRGRALRLCLRLERVCGLRARALRRPGERVGRDRRLGREAVAQARERGAALVERQAQGRRGGAHLERRRARQPFDEGVAAGKIDRHGGRALDLRLQLFARRAGDERHRIARALIELPFLREHREG
jgi:hypothetical protein